MLEQRGKRTRTIAIGAIILLGAVSAVRRAGAATLFDFTGHWTGVAQEAGREDAFLTADLATGAHPRLFAGTIVVEQVPNPTLTCPVKGKLRGLTKVKLRIACEGGTIKVHGLLDPSARSITGGFALRGRHRVHRGTFTLTEQAL